MNLENIYCVSQTIASIAVVGSLIYLGLQVKSLIRAEKGAIS